MTATIELIEETEQRDPTELLAALKQQEAETQRELAHQWQAIVASVADGDVGDLVDVHATISASGHTVDDLAAAVQLIQRRRQWAAEVEAQSAAEATIHRTRDAIAKAEQAYREATETYHSTVQPLLNDRETAANQIIAAFHARRQLVSTCSDHDALAAVQAIDDRMDEARREIADVSDRAETKRRAIAEWLEKNPQGKASDIDRVRGELATMQSTLDKLRAEAERLNRDRIAAEEAMLVPEAI